MSGAYLGEFTWQLLIEFCDPKAECIARRCCGQTFVPNSEMEGTGRAGSPLMQEGVDKSWGLGFIVPLQ